MGRSTANCIFRAIKIFELRPFFAQTIRSLCYCEDICSEPLKRFGSIAKQSCKVLLVK